MNRLREQHSLSAPCKWKLAAAYQLAGQTEVAEELIEGLTTYVSPYRSLTGHYGSNWRDMAMILETLTLMGKRDEAALVLREVAEQLSSQSWMSTQATSYSLVAIAHFLGEQEKGPLECIITWNGKKENLLTNMPILIRDLDASKISKNKLLIENTGAKLIYTRWVNRGQPLHGNEVSKSNDVSLDISYFTANGDGLDVAKIEQGTDFIAKVVVHNESPAGDLHEMALTQIFPSGWEIINQRLSSTPTIAFNSDYSDYQDIRDDRVLTYYNLGKNGKRTYYVRLNAAYLGKYYLPGISTEAMYDASINAMEKGRWVEVVQSGN
jgi:alpha-2-macroglobulin